MANIRDFFKANLKFIIIAVILIVLIIVFIIIRSNNSNELDVYRNIEYNYFAMYSIENKVGVVNSDGEIIIEPEYIDVYIPNPERDVFFCFLNETEYEILNSSGEELFGDYENVAVLLTL